ncbi:VIT family protein [Rouxiella badensis]|jgi:VIT1/CCC1 family predicted Fe2+/Mn2+ transporter|nr:VIT family protein [Rouxiella badensis]QOI56140.1 VIT family protein [Rouxiella badensis subsp. acadiensis]
MQDDACLQSFKTEKRDCRLSRGHIEAHSISHAGWLRAAVLGANDGIVSTASLLLGVAAAQVGHSGLLLTGLAGLVAGAMSMATGEYVSVSSQADIEEAALKEEHRELEEDYHGEFRELAGIYVKRGLSLPLAKQVAEALMAHDALGAHARDELGISEITTARPLQAALTSACSFALGAALPLLVTLLVPHAWVIGAIVVSTLLSLAILGGLAARVGGASVLRGVVRVTFWSALAMGASGIIGSLFAHFSG